jgi:hypothetical protein
VQCKAAPPEETVQRLVRALPARPEAPARWTGPVVQAEGRADAVSDQQVH